ncbi:TPA: hypothetical protein DF272_01635 [Candidatus Falkowbacteria bacterium]|nr:hypothetical protein [Candidatus Falkowbacteria bacterium]
MIIIIGKFAIAYVMIDEIEQKCWDHIQRMVNHPAFENDVCVMPDTHEGKGSVIGFTMVIGRKLIPNVVGVDVGCGMCAFKIGPALVYDKLQIDQIIRDRVPFGHKVHRQPIIDMEHDFPWQMVNEAASKLALGYRNKFGVLPVEPPVYDYEWFTLMCDRIGVDVGYAERSLGTLGGGNHFIEIGRARETGDFWVTVHTGSRNLGTKVCDFWQARANQADPLSLKIKFQYTVQEIKRTVADRKLWQKLIENAKREINKSMADDEMASLTGVDALGYLYDMIFAQIYAMVNRRLISKQLIEAIGFEPQDEIESVHNYIDPTDMTIRKGAIRSYVGERMIIPFNQEDGLLICVGKSNQAWNFSAPHGAGRIMSRNDAKKKLKAADIRRGMDEAGVFTTTIDPEEGKAAYKDSGVIEEAIQPTAEVLLHIVPIHNFKAPPKH